MNRRAFTLVELLVVVFIVLAITAITIPLLVPSTQERSIRSASDLVSSAISRARSLAINNRRSAGIRLERDQAFRPGIIQLSFVEVPAPYGGGVADARIHIGEPGDANGNMTVDPDEDWDGDGRSDTALVWAVTDQSGNPDETWRGLIIQNDRIKVDYRGNLYTIGYVGSAVTAQPDPMLLELGPDASSYWGLLDEAGNPVYFRTAAPTDYNGDGDFGEAGECGGSPFQIIRQPEPSSAAPIQLPSSTAIDLTVSSAADMSLELALADITIMFTPGGNVQNVILEGDATTTPQRLSTLSPIYLMVGLRAFVPANPAPQAGEPTFTFQDLRSRWIGINPINGQVSSASPDALDPTLPVGTLAEKWARVVESQKHIKDTPGIDAR